MEEVLIAAEIVVGACLAAALLVLLYIFLRRRVIARGGDLTLCALRREPQARWKVGLLRCDDDYLCWVPLLGFSPRATHCWPRGGIELGGFAELPPGEMLDPGSVRVVLQGRAHGGKGPDQVELALGQDPYTALRAWVEATPPGRRPVDW